MLVCLCFRGEADHDFMCAESATCTKLRLKVLIIIPQTFWFEVFSLLISRSRFVSKWRHHRNPQKSQLLLYTQSFSRNIYTNRQICKTFNIQRNFYFEFNIYLSNQVKFVQGMKPLMFLFIVTAGLGKQCVCNCVSVRNEPASKHTHIYVSTWASRVTTRSPSDRW